MKPNVLKEIQEMIEQDLATSRQLLALLKQEQESTQARDYANMAQHLKEKSPLLERLKENAQKRSEWLRSLNRAATDENWQRLLTALKQPQLQKQWIEIKSTVEYCQKVNDLNGKLVNRGVTVNRRLLDILRGNQHKSDLYTAKGNKMAAAYSGSLAQA